MEIIALELTALKHSMGRTQTVNCVMEIIALELTALKPIWTAFVLRVETWRS